MPPEGPSDKFGNFEQVWGSEDDRPYVIDLFAWMREKVGIEAGEMLKGDDWLLIIKLHAMVESALNVALVLELREPRLETIIGKLDTSDGSRGKVAFAKALEMLNKDSIDFLQALSTLRNFCVHNIRNFKFDLAKHLVEAKKASELRTALLKGMRGMERQTTAMQQDFVDNKPRLAVFFGCLGIMMQLHVHNEKCRTRDAKDALLQAKAERFDQGERGQSSPTES